MGKQGKRLEKSGQSPYQRKTKKDGVTTNKDGHKLPYKYPEVDNIMNARRSGNNYEADRLAANRQRKVFGGELWRLNKEQGLNHTEYTRYAR